MVARRLFFSDSSRKQLPIANSKSRVPNDYRLVNSTSGFRGVELEITMLKATSINSKSVSRLSYVRRRCTTLDNRGWRQSRNPRTGLRPYAPLSDADLSLRFLRRNGTSYALFSSINLRKFAFAKTRNSFHYAAGTQTELCLLLCGACFSWIIRGFRLCLHPRLSHVFPASGKTCASQSSNFPNSNRSEFGIRNCDPHPWH